MPSRAASPENHAPTVALSIRSVSSTAPCHGAIPFGGTNSIVASSSISSSGTSRTATVESLVAGEARVRELRRRRHRRLRRRTPRCGHAGGRPRTPGRRWRGRAGSSPAPGRRGGRRGARGRLGSAARRRVGEPDDRAADGDALTRFERADDGAVHVAVAHELASADSRRRPPTLHRGSSSTKPVTTISKRSVSIVSSVPMMSSASSPFDSCASGRVYDST